MTVTFGIPSEEHVTMTAGIPLSSTGRISLGRRVIGASRFRRRHDARTGAGAGCLHINRGHLELDGECRLRDEGSYDAFGHHGEHRSHALHEALTNAIDDVDVVALHWPVAHIPALELIGLMGWEVLHRESQLAVFLKRLDKAGRERFGDERDQGA